MELNEGDEAVLMPPDYLRGCARRVVSYIVAISILHLVARLWIRKYSRQYGNGRANMNAKRVSSGKEESPDVILRNSFQLTNMLVNFFLGCVGIYYWFWALPSECSDDEKIGSVEAMRDSDCLTPPFFAEFQLGYQIWSFPLCIMLGESMAMMAHHGFVALLATIATTLVITPRYFCVFFFGVVEISSVFLSMMNAFKSRPYWIKSVPKCFACIKLLFSASFFLTRIILWIPNLCDFCRIVWEMGNALAEENAIYRIIMVAVFTPAAFLTFLQLLWATKIVKGLMKMAGTETRDEENGSNKAATENSTKKD